MSAAVMSSTVYDFGDTILKNHNNSAVRHNNIANVRNVRWVAETNGRAVGSPVDFPHQAQAQRETLARRASNPASPASSNLALRMTQALVISLDNQQQQPQQLSPTLSAPTPTTPTAPVPVPVHRKLDRSHSEPAPCAKSAAAAAAAANAANINTSRYKTELCRPFEESGSCKYGDKCQFAHGGHELRTLVRHPKYKTELCRTYHTIGLCPYGPRCHFVHNDEESLAKPQHQQMSRPKALTLATTPSSTYMGGSTADSPSPTSSLSQSPTNSHRSFFVSSEDVFGSVSPTPSSATANTAFSFGQPDFATLQPVQVPVQVQVTCGPPSTRNTPSPPDSPFLRLPIFNHLSNQVMKIHLDV